MADDNTPQGTVGADDAISIDDFELSDDIIAELVDDPQDEDTEDDNTQQAAEDDSDSDTLEDEDNAEDFDEDDDSDTPDGPKEVKGGQFAPSSAKIKLDDGSTTTVEELRKSYLRQSDYTRKQQDLSVERREVHAARDQVNQVRQQLAEQRQITDRILQDLAPQPPKDNLDPSAASTYLMQRENWDRYVKQVKDEFAKGDQSTSEFDQAERKKRIDAEISSLRQAIPNGYDDGHLRKFISDTEKGAIEEYGFTAQDFAGIEDHRMYLVLRDALRLKAAQKRKPAQTVSAEAKPKVLKGAKRKSRSTRSASAQAGTARLQQTGSLDDFVASISDIDI